MTKEAQDPIAKRIHDEEQNRQRFITNASDYAAFYNTLREKEVPEDVAAGISLEMVKGMNEIYKVSVQADLMKQGPLAGLDALFKRMGNPEDE